MEMGAVLAALALFGVGYNALTAWLEARGLDRGYTAYLVVGGVLVTLAGLGSVDGWPAAGKALLCFAASGLPMVIGSMARSAQARRRDEEGAKRLARELLHDETYHRADGVPSRGAAGDQCK
jgi:hypothetical protein